MAIHKNTSRDMGQLKYYSLMPNDKPLWLLKLQLAISQVYELRGMEDTREEWHLLQDFVDSIILELYNRRDVTIRSEIESALVQEEGKTVLHVKRNKNVVQTYFFNS